MRAPSPWGRTSRRIFRTATVNCSCQRRGPAQTGQSSRRCARRSGAKLARHSPHGQPFPALTAQHPDSGIKDGRGERSRPGPIRSRVKAPRQVGHRDAAARSRQIGHLNGRIPVPPKRCRHFAAPLGATNTMHRVLRPGGRRHRAGHEPRRGGPRTWHEVKETEVHIRHCGEDAHCPGRPKAPSLFAGPARAAHGPTQLRRRQPSGLRHPV